jgi:hypothetical protein
VQKITVLEKGKYQIAVCGGGHADLIEAFIVRAERALEAEDRAVCTRDIPASVSAIHRRLEAELHTFYEKDVALCPDEDKRFKLFIAATCPLAQQYALWVSEGIVLRNMHSNEPELNGWDHNLYAETAKRFFSPNMTIAQAVLASIYTVALAKVTSNSVRDPLSVATVTGHGICLEDANYVKSMEERLGDYENALNRLFLTCSDTTVSLPELEDQLDAFNKGVLNLHRTHIDRQMANTTIEDVFSNNPVSRVPKVPLTLRADGSLTAEHDREKINSTRERWKLMIENAKLCPHFFKCVSCGTEVEYQTEWTPGGTIISHDTAGKETTVDAFGEEAPGGTFDLSKV